MSGPPVVIVGLDCPTGLQSSRIFAARGVPVIGVASDVRHPCARTRTCESVIESPRDPEGLAHTLLEVGRRLDERAVLLPCTDLAVLGVSRHLAELSTHYHAAVPRPEVTEMLLDKARFAEFATVHALPIPSTYVVRCADDLEAAAGAIAYPCVFKPAVKSVPWTSAVASKAVVAESACTLHDLYRKHRRHAEAFVVQEWIPGGDEDHFTCDCYIDRNGRPLVTFCTRKLRQWPPGVGQGCLSVEHRNDVVRETTTRVFEAAGHHGQGYLEMKRDPTTGRHLIIEANVGRPTGRAAAAERAGVELLMTLYCDLAGLPLPRERAQHFRGTKWIHVRRDLQACVTLLARRRLGLRELLTSWKGPFAFALWSRRDPVPFLADWGHAVATAVRRAIRTVRAGVGGGRNGPSTGAPQRASGETSPESKPPHDGGRGVRRGLPGPPRAPVVDFAVPGALVVRTLDAGPSDLRAVTRELGRVRRQRQARPDIVICFVDEVTAPSALGEPDSRIVPGDGGFYCFDPGDPHPLAHVRMGEGWGNALVVCRRGLARIPALSTAIALAALSRGWIPLHASAWVLDGRGVLAAGGAGSGKTGALLSACLHGAAPLGDDRVLLSVDGGAMVGLGHSMSLRDWHLTQLESSIVPVNRVRKALGRVGTLLGRLSSIGRARGADRAHAPSGSLSRVVSGVRRRLGVDVPLERVGQRNGTSARPDLVLLLETRAQSEIVAEPVDGSVAVSQLARDVEKELMSALRRQMTSPENGSLIDGSWRGVEHVPRVAARLLREAMRTVPIFRLTHPPECSLEELHGVISELLPLSGPERGAAATGDPSSHVPLGPATSHAS